MEKTLESELIDETMSDEPAFTSDNTNSDEKDGFAFDEVQEETPADSQPESEQVEDNSASDENKQPVVDEDATEEEQRVPYSRFESKVRELQDKDQTIQELETQLAQFQQQQQQTADTSPEDIEVPPEWVELYGDSDASKRAFKVQMQREQQLLERATEQAIERLQSQQQEAEETYNSNLSIIENELSTLRDEHGKAFTPEVEEEVLAIVDEFSPVGEDGKYASIFPFDKAYEIYQLRNSSMQAQTTQARTQVADLSTGGTEGEVDSESDANFSRSWDNWRDAL